MIGVHGHAPGLIQAFRARRDARGPRRLDRTAEAICALVRQTNVTIAAAPCMSFGVGTLLNEAVVLWLAGASRVVGVDYFPILDWSASREALHRADETALLTALDRISDEQHVRRRLTQLRALPRWTPAALAELGIVYHAPSDFSDRTPFPAQFAFIVSLAVLEHLPVDGAHDIVAQIHHSLKPGGVMVHNVHLEDHRDFARAPHAFLAASTDWRPTDCDLRGNRLRSSDWQRIFASLPNARVHVLEEHRRPEHPLPTALDPRFAGHHPDDLAVSALVAAVYRQG
jgi:SAM-dependent methyltransferase